MFAYTIPMHRVYMSFMLRQAWAGGAPGPVINREGARYVIRSCAPFIAYFAMSGRRR